MCFGADLYSEGTQQGNLHQSVVMTDSVSYFIFRGKTWETALAKTNPIKMQGKDLNLFLFLNGSKWTGQIDIRRRHGSGQSMHGYILTYRGFKGRTSVDQLWVLSRRGLNSCLRCTTLREFTGELFCFISALTMISGYKVISSYFNGVSGVKRLGLPPISLDAPSHQAWCQKHKTIRVGHSMKI